MTGVLRAVFGARGQLVVGILMGVLAVFQTCWWTWVSPPTLYDLFLVSMEALLFGSFNQIGNGLGYRATERVEEHVVNNISEEGPS